MKQTWLVHKLLRIGYVVVWRLGALARPWRKTSLTANSRDDGNPGFYINRRMLCGAQPREAFVKLIEQELAPRR